MSSTLEAITSSEPSGQPTIPVKARLKWFNGPKGFGFVNPEERPEVDAFLHITTLQEAGLQAIGEGACLMCVIEYGDKGAHVRQVADIIDIGILPAGISCDGPVDAADIGQIQKMKGSVKWYKEDQGFGFIVPEDGMKDVFIHKSCLDKHDLGSLEPGQKVFMTFRTVPKGREVISFKIID